MERTALVRDVEAVCAVDAGPAFVLASGRETLVATGMRQALNEAPAGASWSSQVQAFAADRGGHDGAPLLVGALPFDHATPAHLFQPRSLIRLSGDAVWPGPPQPAPTPAPAVAPRRWQVTAEPTRAQYERNVADVLSLLRAGADEAAALHKVVLARRLLLRAEAPIDVDAVLRRLRLDRSVTVFAVPMPPHADGGPRTLVGATPELLVDKIGRDVVSEPLAGSARRLADAAADRAAAAALLRSDKDRREHAAVAEWIADRLAPYCRRLQVPAAPSLVSTRFMWHLGTRIEGELRDRDLSSVEIAELLHPTPAVCGLPRDRARSTIACFEPFDREFFAGAVGWSDARGDGRWLMTIRCADIAGSAARLYAGAGIVAGSDPQAEAAETSAKLAALLDALGVDEDGCRLAGEAR